MRRASFAGRGAARLQAEHHPQPSQSSTGHVLRTRRPATSRWLLAMAHTAWPYSSLHKRVGIPAKALRALRRRFAMPKMVVTHAVVDVERWLKGKAERSAAIGPFATNVTDHVAADGSNNVAITADVHDMSGAQAMMASPSPDLSALHESVQASLRPTSKSRNVASPRPIKLRQTVAVLLSRDRPELRPHHGPRRL